MNQENEPTKPAPRTLKDLENDEPGWRFGLRSLILGTNLIALFIAIVQWTQGSVFGFILLAGFALPFLVMIGLMFVVLFESATDRNFVKSNTFPRQSTRKDPFD